MTGIQNALAAAKRAAAALYEVAGIYAREIKERLDALFEKASHFMRFAMAFLVAIFIVAWIWHPLAMIVVPLLIAGGLAVAFTALTNYRALEIFAGIAGVEELLASHSALVKELEDSLHKLLVEIRTMITWLCAAGIYLAIVPISNDRVLAFPFLLVLVGIVFAGELKWLRYGLILLLFVFTGIFWNGGRDKVKAETEAMHITTPPAPAWFQANVICPQSVKKTYDFFELSPAPSEFTYTPAKGCWSKIVVPAEWPNWHIQSLHPEKTDGLIAVACQDIRIAALPQSPNSGASIRCGIDRTMDPKGFRTFFVQGTAELLVMRMDR